MFGYLTLLTGLALSAVAAWFAVLGIVALFSGLPLYAAIMGIAVEAGKIVGVTWIYRHWEAKTKLKFVMIPFVFVMMLLTSMGIFGLLSKAHIEQTAPVTNNGAKIERLDQRIARERTEIADAVIVVDQLDQTIQVLVDARKISHPTEGSRVVRINQQPQRDQLKEIINESFDSIDEYEDAKLLLNQELNELELEVGPVKYIAAIIYDDSESRLDEAVRIVIIAFIFVFDPMAILLLMAGNYTIMGRIGAVPDKPEPISKPKGIVPNAKTEFVTAEVIAEVISEAVNEAKILTKPTPPPGRYLKEGEVPPKPKPPENEIVKEYELPPSGAPTIKAKAEDVAAKPRGNHGIRFRTLLKEQEEAKNNSKKDR